MSSPIFAPEKIHRWRKPLKSLLASLIIAVAVIGAASLWFYVSARRALPQFDGFISVSGLSAPVSVTRNAQGVPAIAAGSLQDLFFAQGYVAAQDRLWQMDMTRRYASGRLSEVLGSKTLKSDVRQRTLLIPVIAERAAAALPASDRAYLEAYARGVNAYIDSHRGRLPIEFRVLHYSPQPWTIIDSLLVGISMSEMLNLETLDTPLKREEIAAKLGPELAADLYPNSSFRDHPPVPGTDEAEDNPIEPSPDEEWGLHPKDRVPNRPESGAKLTPSSTAELDPLRPGSNNWVLSGLHTASGKPLLSNDMHLPHQLPNTWYEAHLTSGDFDVAGVSLPGMPFVIVGHNRRIAWGFTNIGPAVTDFYVETINGEGQYLTPDGWKQLEHRREKIAVRWGKDVEIDVAVTRHGPIVNSLIPGEKRALALKWVLFDPAASQVPFFDVDSAQNWSQFRQAFSRFGSPGQNVVYADVDGHIGYQATGFVPLRPWAEQEQYVGFPLPGADNSHEWTGYISFDKMPSVLDPESGIIATANGRITPDGYPYLVSTEWGSAYRTERIYRVLGTNKKFTSADMLALQNDIYSDFDRFCAQRFAYAIDHSPKASARTREAADLMRKWDGRVTADSAAATIVSASRKELVRMLLEPRLGASYTNYGWFMSSVWLENVLLMQPQRWLPAGFSDFNSLFAAAVEKALAEKAPRKLAGWHWGESSPIYVQHALFGAIPILRTWTGPGLLPQSGNGYTVKQVGRSFGPSERFTVDFSDFDNSTLNVLTGQSGNVFSSNYLDQWSAWYAGTTFTLPYSDSSVRGSAAHVLTLKPPR